MCLRTQRWSGLASCPYKMKREASAMHFAVAMAFAPKILASMIITVFMCTHSLTQKSSALLCMLLRCVTVYTGKTCRIPKELPDDMVASFEGDILLNQHHLASEVRLTPRRY